MPYTQEIPATGKHLFTAAGKATRLTGGVVSGRLRPPRYHSVDMQSRQAGRVSGPAQRQGD